MLEYIPIVGKLFKTIDKGMDLASEAITDKDKLNEMIAHLEQMKSVTTHLAELQVKTIPWMDGIHKLGRQICNLVTVIAVAVLIGMGHTFTQTEVYAILGGNAVYHVLKGQGQK